MGARKIKNAICGPKKLEARGGKSKISVIVSR
jgi:hypothetical protein